MKRQSFLVKGPTTIRESDRALIKWHSHVNKGKQYPYASERQNKRYAALCARRLVNLTNEVFSDPLWRAAE